MFVGHFGVANVLIATFPTVPPLVAYAGVSFPDLLWGGLVLAGVETVHVDPTSPLQTRTTFVQYRYSHSLLVTNGIALVLAGLLSIVLHNLWAGFVFVTGSVSHWVLDVVVRRDLPIWGFGQDRRIGWGLWNHARWAFVADYAFFALPTLAVWPWRDAGPVLLVGAVFHLANANAFFGWTRRNPWGTPRRLAAVVLFGFVSLSWALHGLLP